MSVLFRTLTYGTLFVGLLLIYLPSRLLAWSGVTRPVVMEWPQIAAILIAGIGAGIALLCVSAFVRIGKGTPAPFDPPRRLVIRGPYRLVRNPMYIGAALVLAGTALFYRSAAVLAFFAAFLLVAHLFVVLYKEPTLRRNFGPDYEIYCARVGRWLPASRATR